MLLSLQVTKSGEKLKIKSNMVWNRCANLHHESSCDSCWQQQHKEVGSLLHCEPKRVAQNWIEELFIDHKLGADDSPC